MRGLVSVVLLAALAGCNPSITQDEKRWASLNGDEVYAVSGYETIVHANQNCPALAQAKGTLGKYKVKDERLVDEQGIFLNSPRERLPLCDRCVPSKGY